MFIQITFWFVENTDNISLHVILTVFTYIITSDLSDNRKFYNDNKMTK